VPAELHANHMQWLTGLCVMRCYVSVMWTHGKHRSVWLRVYVDPPICLVTLSSAYALDNVTKNQCSCGLFITIEQKIHNIKIKKINKKLFGLQKRSGCLRRKENLLAPPGIEP
jgi:hypothetical protein